MKRGHIQLIIGLFFLFGAFQDLCAQTPKWVQSYGTDTNYESSDYLIGFGMAQANDNVPIEVALEIAASNSRSDLIQKVIVDVQSRTQTFEDETNGNYSSQFTSETQASSQLELFGLDVENFVQENKVYVLSNVQKNSLFEQYLSKKESLLLEFQQKNQNGKENLAANNKNEALQYFIEAKPLYYELLKTWSVVKTLEGKNTTSSVDWSPTAIYDDFEYLNQQIGTLTNRSINSLEDAVWILINNIGTESQEAHQVNVNNITFEDSGISSKFANLLRQNLIAELGSRTSWTVVETNAQLDHEPTHILGGNFWEVGNNAVVNLNLREIESGSIVASTDASIPKTVLEENGLELLPENYEKAIQDLHALKQNSGDSRGLKLEAWTTKGQDQLVYEEGELMEVSLQVNLPSYVRILYHLNDGTRVLLTDSYFINERSINKPYTLPYQFECVAPFGVEMMQVIAQTEPFERVQTKMIDGVPYLAEDLEEFLSNTRGFKIKKQELQQAEEILTITTMSK